MTLGFYFIGGGLSVSSALVVSLITFLPHGLSMPSFYLVQGPFGVLAVSTGLPEMFHFFLEKLRFITNHFGPVHKCVLHYTKLAGDGDCPTVDIDPCGWLSYVL